MPAPTNGSEYHWLSSKFPYRKNEGFFVAPNHDVVFWPRQSAPGYIVDQALAETIAKYRKYVSASILLSIPYFFISVVAADHGVGPYFTLAGIYAEYQAEIKGSFDILFVFTILPVSGLFWTIAWLAYRWRVNKLTRGIPQQNRFEMARPRYQHIKMSSTDKKFATKNYTGMILSGIFIILFLIMFNIELLILFLFFSFLTTIRYFHDKSGLLLEEIIISQPFEVVRTEQET